MSPTNHAESSSALFQGRALTVAIHHPGPEPADHALVDGFWSSDDGDSWGPAVTLPNNGADYVSDPTVDFMEDGTAYVLLLGQTYQNHECGQSKTGSDVFWATTSDGVAYANHGAIDDTNGNDHPWLAIDRNPAGLDRVHAAWWDTAGGAVKYRTMLQGGAWDPIRTLDVANDGSPVVTVGQGAVYVVWSGRVCRVNAAFTDCEATQVFNDGDWAFDDSRLPIPPFDEPYNPEPEPYLEGRHGFSIRASPAQGNVLYYAYQRQEPDGVHRDIWFARLTYFGGNPPFTPSPPVRVTNIEAYEDGTDQFGPAVSVVGGGGGPDLVSVTWYDRRSPDGDCAGEVNRCYRAKRAVSLDGGFTFVHTQDLPSAPGNPQTDPLLLPLHCGRPSNRFIGEYHETTGDFLHTMQVVTGVPLGSDPESSGLSARWISPGYYYGSEP